MAISKTEETFTICYKDFCVSANGQAIKTLAGVALTLVVIAGVISLTQKKHSIILNKSMKTTFPKLHISYFIELKNTSRAFINFQQRS